MIADDGSLNPLDEQHHEHDYDGGIPDRLPSSDIRELSKLKPSTTYLAIATEWTGIAVAIFLCEQMWHPAVYIFVVVFIGARQHALAVLGHDASHYLIVRNRRLNDWIGNLFLFWPIFASVELFRFFHGTHHRFLNQEQDGNRILWKTHTSDGELTKEWTYPKTLPALISKILRKMAFVHGLGWIIGGGFLGMLRKSKLRRDSWWYVIFRLAYYVSIIASLVYAGYGEQFFDVLDRTILYLACCHTIYSANL